MNRKKIFSFLILSDFLRPLRSQVVSEEYQVTLKGLENGVRQNTVCIHDKSHITYQGFIISQYQLRETQNKIRTIQYIPFVYNIKCDKQEEMTDADGQSREQEDLLYKRESSTTERRKLNRSSILNIQQVSEHEKRATSLKIF